MLKFVGEVLVFEALLVSIAFDIVSWCNTASVVFYMGLLSAFEATRAHAGTVVQPVNGFPPAKNGVAHHI